MIPNFDIRGCIILEIQKHPFCVILSISIFARNAKVFCGYQQVKHKAITKQLALVKSLFQKFQFTILTHGYHTGLTNYGQIMS